MKYHTTLFVPTLLATTYLAFAKEGDLQSKCNSSSIELFVLQDGTASFDGMLKKASKQKTWETMINELIPSSAKLRVGAGRFGDKAGSWGYCWRESTPLTDDLDYAKSSLTAMNAAIFGGGSAPEQSPDAMVYVASKYAGFTPVDSKENNTIVRILVIVADSRPHYWGSGYSTYGLSANAKDNTDPTGSMNCNRDVKYLYPEQIHDNLVNRGIHYLVLTHNDPKSSMYDVDPEPAWKNFMANVAKLPEDQYTIQPFDLDPTNAANEIVKFVNYWNCPSSSTSSSSTAKPTTKSTSTAKPTTASTSTAKPTTKSTSTAKPTTKSTSTAKPTTKSTSTAKPTTTSTTTAKPTTTSTTTAKPTTTSTTTAKPTTTSTTTAKPTTTSTTTAKPTTTSTTTAKPTTTSTTTAKPTTTELTTGSTSTAKLTTGSTNTAKLTTATTGPTLGPNSSTDPSDTTSSSEQATDDTPCDCKDKSCKHNCHRDCHCHGEPGCGCSPILVRVADRPKHFEFKLNLED